MPNVEHIKNRLLAERTRSEEGEGRFGGRTTIWTWEVLVTSLFLRRWYL